MQLTYTEALELANAAVAEMGEGYIYINPMGEVAGDTPEPIDCVYFDEITGLPSCIVGRVLAAKGITESNIGPHKGSYSTWVIEHLEGKGIITVDSAAKDFLDRIQYDQDRGKPWGDAIADAVKKHDENQL